MNDPGSPQTAPWHLLGVGSIGGLFAARLHAAGIPVTLILRDAHRCDDYRATGGLAIETAAGQWQHSQPPATTARAMTMPPRLLLVTTKAPDTLDALAPLLADNGAGQLVLLLQNGMGVSERLRTRWPQLRIWNAVTTAGVWRAADWRLHCVAEGETLVGRRDDAGDAALDIAVTALVAAGLCVPVADIHAVLWRKLAVNAVINALTAIHHCRNGELLEIPVARAQIAALAAEVETVAAAANIHFDEPVLAMAERVIRLTADNFSSMNRDVVAGRATEIDFINGYLVELARRHDIAVPANERVLGAVRALART